MSHSVYADPAAERIERFLAEWPQPNGQGVVSRATSDVSLTVDDLRAVLTELNEYQQAVSAVLAVCEQHGAGDYNRALSDVRTELGRHIIGLEA